MGCGVGFLKFLLIGLCVLYGVLAIAFSAAGIYLIVQVQKIPDLGDEAKWAPAIFLTIGIFLGVVATFGCAGAVTGNKCLLIIFATVTIVMLVATFVFGIAILVVGSKMGDKLLELLSKAFKKGEDAAHTWLGPIEKTLKCCGINDKADYTSALPSTCCLDEPDSCLAADAYSEGCGTKVVNKMMESSKAIGACCILLAIVQVIAVIGAYMLMSKSASYEQV
ncbi:unnamed protein product [Dibothriocephalus latus]|uniref:Tetraspanin n=1 Tax=Dibothriocephalus latus TaxID=60516 RepID=A0A3P7PZU8_DIBLA|nr:unnamed protein product [Dibothriocephalus latus]